MSQLRACKDKVFVLVIYGVHRRVAIGVYLIENNLSLLVEFVVGEGGVKDYIRHQLHSLREVATQHRSVNGGVLLCGVGVQLATEVFQSAVHLVRLAMLGTLEEAVLGEVGNTLLALALVTSTCIYHYGTSCYPTLCLAVYAANAV